MKLTQLLCITTPLPGADPISTAALLKRHGGDFDRLFSRHGDIHYATFTILPASPQGTADPAGVSLAVTLAVSAELAPREIVERLLALDFPTMALLFGPGAPAPKDAAQLLAFLMRSETMQTATGGFVGARDRTVAQIRCEAALAQWLRQTAAATAVSPGDDTSALASRWSTQALARAEFSWAKDPAPKSRWREHVAPDFLRIGATAGFLVLIMSALLAVGALALIGHSSKLAVAALNGWIGIVDADLTVGHVFFEGKPFGPWLRGLILLGLVANGLSAFLARFRRATLFGFELTIFLSAVVVLIVFPVLGLLALDDFWRAALAQELSLGNTHVFYGLWVAFGLVGVAAALAGCGVIALLLTPPYLSLAALRAAWLLAGAAAAGVIHLGLVASVRAGVLFHWPGADRLDPGHTWGWQCIDRVAIVILGIVLVLALAVRLGARFAKADDRWFPRLNAPFKTPAKPPFTRLHQTAPSVDACEAAWAGRTGIMVSLTELRQPFWVFGPLARVSLWLISSLGWHYFSEGSLGDVRSIQFAHWHLIDKGRRMLFCANFDGNFGGYLDDFISSRIPLLNLIWRWTCLQSRVPIALGGPALDAAGTSPRDFPRTRLLVFAGGRSEQQFKAFARESMLPFQYHFQAYDRNLAAILGATRLRDAVGGPRDASNDDVVLRASET